jgi:VanZ family protein
MPRNQRQSHRLLSSRLPVVALVLACTAIPEQLVPPSHARITSPLGIDLEDVVENIAGYVPLGAVLTNIGTATAVKLTASLSVFAEATQLFSEGRSTSLIDIAANVIGAALGVVLCARLKIDLTQMTVGRRVGGAAAALAVGYVALGSPIGPRDLAGAVAIMAAETPWRHVSPRGATAAGILEARWTFDAVEGRTTSDTSSNAISGTLVNQPTLVMGVDGRALGLNGMSQWVDFGDPVALRLTGSMTISAWINPSVFPRDDAAIVSSLSGEEQGYQLDTTVDQGTRTIGFKLGGTAGRLMARYGRTPLQTDQWYHVAGVYDAPRRTLNVYLNGHSDDGCLLGRVTNRQEASSLDVFVGRRAGGNGYEFAGSVDDVRIYSRALTPAEIEGMTTALGTGVTSRASDEETDLNRSDRTCPSKEGTDARISGTVVAFGILIAVACVGLWPTSKYHVPALILSFLAGFLLIPSIAPLVPPHFQWLVPILTLAGGTSVALSSRS